MASRSTPLNGTDGVKRSQLARKWARQMEAATEVCNVHMSHSGDTASVLQWLRSNRSSNWEEIVPGNPTQYSSCFHHLLPLTGFGCL